jgi:hypothetical protein
MHGMRKSKAVLGKTFYVAAIGIFLVGVVEVFEGARMGTAPESVLGKTAASVIEARSGKHLVRIFGLLTDCQKAYDEMENGKKGRRFYLATDVNKEQTFILNSPSECDESEMHVYEGTLEKTPSYVTKLLANAGVASGLERNPLYLSVGEKGSDTTQRGLILGAVGLIGFIGTWWSRKQANQPTQIIAGDHEVFAGDTKKK